MNLLPASPDHMTNDGMPRTLFGGNIASSALCVRLAIAFMAMAWLVGCASTPPPRGVLDGAERAISDAREARAEDFAAVDLGRAQERLAAARAAMAERDYDQAAVYATQAEVDARVAEVRSRSATGRAEIQRRTEENARLRRDLLGESR